MLTAWLTSFLLTLAVEVPVAAWLLRDLRRHRAVVGAAALGTTLTHPVFWFVAPALFDQYWAYIVTGELTILAVEAVVIELLLHPGWRAALSTSALMNGASYLVGLILTV